AVPIAQVVVDLKGGQGEGDERGDPVAGLQAQGGFRVGFLDDAGQHAARAGHRIVHLAAGDDDLAYGSPDGVAVATVRPVQLPVGGGVEVEAVHADADLAGTSGRVRVEAGGGLREHAGAALRRVGDPVLAERPGE